MFDLEQALRTVIETDGSDLHLKVPSRPIIRTNGRLDAIEGTEPLGPEETEQVFVIPARYLVRGDNLVTVTAPEGSLGARLLEIRYRQKPPA